jgi:DNA-nicking Smr family endonuclease
MRIITDAEKKLWELINKATTLMGQPRKPLFILEKYSPPTSIDLHGCTLEQAFKETIHYVHEAFEYKLKNITIITGKGDRHPETSIRRELPFWLENPRIDHMVSSYELINNGAFLIKLKKHS